MDGKVTAFDNLALYAYQLQGDFAPWLNETADLALAALQFQHSERVREVCHPLLYFLLTL